MSCNPLAYSYEADWHCPGCAKARFGESEHGHVYGTDREGNEVGPLFGWEDGWVELGEGCQKLVCGTCGGTIDTWHDPACAGECEVV